MKIDAIKIGKFLSYALRHAPEKAGVRIDANGWVFIDDLVNACVRNGYDVDYDVILDIVENNDKQRYSISICGNKIRANQGHSINVDVELKEVVPPDILFHGTAKKFVSSILEQGLMPKSRLYVHLSSDQETATKVGQRHGVPVILKINTGAMHRDNVKFYVSDNNVWLVKTVDKKYIEIF